MVTVIFVAHATRVGVAIWHEGMDTTSTYELRAMFHASDINKIAFRLGAVENAM
jgi:hypothetical protein